MSTLENRWHDLPCGAKVYVFNGKAQAVEVSCFITEGSLGIPPADDVILKEIHELVGYPVMFSTQWYESPERPVKVAALKEKLVLDRPDQF